MALAHVGGSIMAAAARMAKAAVVDDKVLADVLNDVARGLLQADVRFDIVANVQGNIRSAVVNLQSLPAHDDRRHAIEQAVVAELHRVLHPAGAGAGTPSFSSLAAPTRGKKPATVVLFVGLPCSGKTTTCVKYADYHRRHKGCSPALVCAADTFWDRHQLAQSAAKAGIPFYAAAESSSPDPDPVKVAVDGVHRFRNDDRAAKGCDLIVVDTSGRHRPGDLEETRQMAEATRADLVVLVVDAGMGQSASDQVLAFASAVGVGAVIVTKMDAHAKGFGALTAVAATARWPVIFLGTGEHVGDLEAFDAGTFVTRLLLLGMRQHLPRFTDNTRIGGRNCPCHRPSRHSF